jgi:hypothetical protein
MFCGWDRLRELGRNCKSWSTRVTAGNTETEGTVSYVTWNWHCGSRHIDTLIADLTDAMNYPIHDANLANSAHCHEMGPK